MGKLIKLVDIKPFLGFLSRSGRTLELHNMDTMYPFTGGVTNKLDKKYPLCGKQGIQTKKEDTPSSSKGR
jgi:hypothetical protein